MVGENRSFGQKFPIGKIIIIHKSKYKITNCSVLQGAICDTDHHLLVVKIVYPYQINIMSPLQEQQNKKRLDQRDDTI